VTSRGKKLELRAARGKPASYAVLQRSLEKTKRGKEKRKYAGLGKDVFAEVGAGEYGRRETQIIGSTGGSVD
jgi:hypothetical protein